MTTNRCARVAVLPFLFALAGCGQGEASTAAAQPGAPVLLEGRLTITGSSTIAPLVQEMARRFEQQHPEVRIDVQTGGSSRGVADARSGLAQIGMASRELGPDERDLTATTIAQDGVALIVHRDNPVTTLTSEQVVAIFRGQSARWSDVGGRDAAITVVNKAEGRSTLALFCDHFDLEAREIRASVVIGDNEQGIRTVAANPDSIGYVSIGTAETDIARGVAIKMLPLGGVTPSTAALRDGTYPLARPLNLVTRGEPPPRVAAFLAFASSAAVGDLVAAQAFVPPTR